MSKLLTNNLSSYWLPGAGDDDVHISLTEYYEIIDPALPREERFRTDHIALCVDDVEWEVGTSHLLELAGMFLRAAQIAEERLPKVSPSGEAPALTTPHSGTGGGTNEGEA